MSVLQPRDPDHSVNVSKHNILWEAFVLITGVVVIGLIVFIGSGYVGDFAADHISFDSEKKIFRQKKGIPIAEQECRVRYLNQIKDKLLASEPELKELIHIEISPESLPNAFAMPGGRIQFTEGSLPAFKSENGLAMVIGHEIGHVAGRHHLKKVSRTVLISLFLSLVGFGDQGIGNVVSAPTELALLAYSRENENWADDYGRGLVESAYGHINGAAEFFRFLRNRNSMLDKVSDKLNFLSTHPRTEARIEFLESQKAEGELTPLRMDIRSPILKADCPLADS